MHAKPMGMGETSVEHVTLWVQLMDNRSTLNRMLVKALVPVYLWASNMQAQSTLQRMFALVIMMEDCQMIQLFHVTDVETQPVVHLSLIASWPTLVLDCRECNIACHNRKF